MEIGKKKKKKKNRKLFRDPRFRGVCYIYGSTLVARLTGVLKLGTARELVKGGGVVKELLMSLVVSHQTHKYRACSRLLSSNLPNLGLLRHSKRR